MDDRVLKSEIKRLLREAHASFKQDDLPHQRRVFERVLLTLRFDSTGHLTEKVALCLLELARHNPVSFGQVAQFITGFFLDGSIPARDFRYDLTRQLAANPEMLAGDIELVRRKGFGIRHSVLCYTYDIADELKDWKLTQFIGEGGFGFVFKARRKFQNTEDQYQEVALKVIRTDASNNFDIQTRFSREMQLLAGLQHSHIAPLIDFSDSPGALWYATSLLDGDNLGRLVDSRGHLTSKERVNSFLTQMLSALDFSHGRGLIHRDVSPYNIIFVPKNQAFWLIDFGLAIDLQSVDEVSGGSGNFGWMSPEQIAGNEISPATDIWSIAAVCTFIASGKSLFASNSRSDRLREMNDYGSTTQKLERWLPKDLSLFLKAFLNPDPRKRPTANEALTHLNGHGLSAMPPITRRSSPYENQARQFPGLHTPVSDDMEVAVSEERVSQKLHPPKKPRLK